MGNQLPEPRNFFFAFRDCLAGGLLQSHLPILNGSLKTLAAQRARHKVYLHINNTKPILWMAGPERQLLDEFGIEVAVDGMTIEL